MKENCEFWNSRRVFEQILKNKYFSLFHSNCISIDEEFQRKSINVYYLRVLLLNLSIINQTLFQWRWIESGQFQENCHFYLFEMDQNFLIIERKGIL